MYRIFLFFITASIGCFAAATDSANCLNEQSTQSKIECFTNASRIWDERLNTVYKQLLAKLDTLEGAKLKASQRQWVAFKEKETAFIDQAFAWNPQTKGTLVKVYRVQFILEITRSRTLTLKSI